MKPTLVFDVGHGGRDPGTTSGGIVEKALQLDIALATRLQLLAGYEVAVVLTRDSDTDVSLQRRVDIAHANRADAMFSFHHNSFEPNPSKRGLELYVYGPISWVNSTGQYASRSYAIAKKMEPILAEGLQELGIVNNGVKDGDFHVLRETNLPAVLFELFYASSPYEAGIAKKPDFVERVSKLYAKAIAEAMGLQEKPRKWGADEAEYVQAKKIIQDIPVDLDAPASYRWVLTIIARVLSRFLYKDGRF